MDDFPIGHPPRCQCNTEPMRLVDVSDERILWRCEACGTVDELRRVAPGVTAHVFTLP